MKEHNIKLNKLNGSKILSRSLYKKILNDFEKFGAIRLKNFSPEIKMVLRLTNLFSKSYSNDAMRRPTRFGYTNIRNTDSGKQRIDLHSEASFSPSRPEIIWFYCLKKPQTNSGKTIICDGETLWDDLLGSTKKFFIENPIVYSLKIPFVANIKGSGKTKWSLNFPGVKNCFFNRDKKTLEFDFVSYAVMENKFTGKLSFTNHLLVTLKSEPQLLSRKLLNGRNVPTQIMREIISKSKKNTFKINWRDNDLIMIDNIRFLHGREKININEKRRDIVVIQTARKDFIKGIN